MLMIISMKTTRECFDALTDLFKKKALIQEEGHIEITVMFTKEKNIYLIVTMNK